MVGWNRGQGFALTFCFTYSSPTVHWWVAAFLRFPLPIFSTMLIEFHLTSWISVVGDMCHCCNVSCLLSRRMAFAQRMTRWVSWFPEQQVVTATVCFIMHTTDVYCFREEEFLKKKDLFRRNAFLIIKEMVGLSSAHPSVFVDEVWLMNLSVPSCLLVSYNTKTSLNVFSHHRFFTASSFWERSTRRNIPRKILWLMTTCWMCWRGVTLSLLNTIPLNYPSGVQFPVC